MMQKATMLCAAPQVEALAGPEAAMNKALKIHWVPVGHPALVNEVLVERGFADVATAPSRQIERRTSSRRHTFRRNVHRTTHHHDWDH